MKSAEEIKQEAIKACEEVMKDILANREDLTEIPGFWTKAIKMCEEKIKKIDIK